MICIDLHGCNSIVKGQRCFCGGKQQLYSYTRPYSSHSCVDVRILVTFTKGIVLQSAPITHQLFSLIIYPNKVPVMCFCSESVASSYYTVLS